MPPQDLDEEHSRGKHVVMLHLGTIVIMICALVILLALARLITRWFADR